ncbi:putative transcription factor Znf-LSD family [Helianthus anomalus]
MLMLVDCFNCRTPLQLQPYATSSNHNYALPPPPAPSPYSQLPSLSQILHLPSET